MKRLSFLALLLITFLGVKGQELRISNIEFIGSKKIKTTFLAKTTFVRVGDVLNIEEIEFDVQNLTLLPPVAKSSYKIDTLDSESVTVNYIIEDAVTFFPNLIAGRRNGNIWFGIGASTLNLFKSGQQLTANYVRNDGDNNGNIFYRLPYVGRTKWSLGGSLVKNSSIEPLIFGEERVSYRYSILSAGIIPSFNFTPRHVLEFQGSVFRENYLLEDDPKYIVADVPVEVNENKLLLVTSFTINQFKYDYYQLKGWSNRIAFDYVTSLSDKYLFTSLTEEIKYFHRIGKLTNIGVRFKFGIATNNESPFAPFVVDNDVNIRGIGTRIKRGTAEALLNLEIRQGLFSLGRFAGQAVVFGDAGNWRLPGNNLDQLVNKSTFRFFTGAGFRLIYTRGHNYIFRIDYGINVRGANQAERNGLVIGVGQFF